MLNCRAVVMIYNPFWIFLIPVMHDQKSEIFAWTWRVCPLTTTWEQKRTMKWSKRGVKNSLVNTESLTQSRVSDIQEQQCCCGIIYGHFDLHKFCVHAKIRRQKKPLGLSINVSSALLFVTDEKNIRPFLPVVVASALC